MTQREIEKLQYDKKFLQKLKILYKRRDLENKSLEAWWNVIWEDIMTEGERELFCFCPENFCQVIGYMQFVGDNVVRNYRHPDLPPPIKWPDAVWIYNAVDTLYYHQGDKYITNVPDYPTIQVPQFWIEKKRLVRDGWNSVLDFGSKSIITYKQKKEKAGWYIPSICWNVPGKEFFTDLKLTHTLVENEEESKKTLQLPDNERTRHLKETLLEYIKVFREEIYQRMKLWDFLITPGVGVKTIQKLWPELFA